MDIANTSSLSKRLTGRQISPLFTEPFNTEGLRALSLHHNVWHRKTLGFPRGQPGEQEGQVDSLPEPGYQCLRSRLLLLVVWFHDRFLVLVW